MQRAQLLALAGAIQAIRNDWDRAGIISQLTKLNDTWIGPDADLGAHAMIVAANPQAQTPGALNAMKTVKATAAPIPGAKEPKCFICGNYRTKCLQLYDFETRHGLPNPHDFESEADATHNSAHYKRQQRQAAIAQLAQSKSIPA